MEVGRPRPEALAERDQQIDEEVSGEGRQHGDDEHGLPSPSEAQTKHDQGDDEEDRKWAHRGPRFYFGGVTTIESER